MYGYTTERIKLLTMEIKKLIKKALTLACVYFTIIIICYMALLAFFNIGEKAIAVQGYRVVLYMLAGILLALASFIRGLKINSALKVILHYFICAFTFFVCFILPMEMRASFAVVGIAIFTLIYALVRIIIFLFKSKLNKNRERPSEYKSQFSNKNK